MNDQIKQINSDLNISREEARQKKLAIRKKDFESFLLKQFGRPLVKGDKIRGTVIFKIRTFAVVGLKVESGLYCLEVEGQQFGFGKGFLKDGEFKLVS